MSTDPDPGITASVVAAAQGRALDEHAFRTLFADARTANAFLPVPVARELLERITTHALLGPTSANTLPMRLLFVESGEAKDRLLATLSPGNVEKTKSAPVTAIFAADMQFFEHIPRLTPNAPHYKSLFDAPDKADVAKSFSFMNATLQGAYFMLAARGAGLDVGPMGGFDKEKLDAAFFPDGRFKSIWLANLGYGDDSKLFPRNPRFAFAEVAQFV